MKYFVVVTLALACMLAPLIVRTLERVAVQVAAAQAEPPTCRLELADGRRFVWPPTSEGWCRAVDLPTAMRVAN